MSEFETLELLAAQSLPHSTPTAIENTPTSPLAVKVMRVPSVKKPTEFRAAPAGRELVVSTSVRVTGVRPLLPPDAAASSLRSPRSSKILATSSVVRGICRILTAPSA